MYYEGDDQAQDGLCVFNLSFLPYSRFYTILMTETVNIYFRSFLQIQAEPFLSFFLSVSTHHFKYRLTRFFLFPLQIQGDQQEFTISTPSPPSPLDPYKSLLFPPTEFSLLSSGMVGLCDQPFTSSRCESPFSQKRGWRPPFMD